MQYAIFLFVVVGKVALGNGGVVRPQWVEDEIMSMEGAPKISKYKVRQFFKECKEDGLLAFDGNQYVWRETHAANYIGQDVIASMKGIS